MPPAVGRFLAAHYRPVGRTPILTPGLGVDRSRLGRGPVTITIPANGVYRIDWQGETVGLDGETVTNGGEIFLTAGPHRLAARGFVQELELRLVQRAGRED
jgi:hypothetical protein